MTEVGYATLGIIPSFDGFERNLSRGMSSPLNAAGVSGGRQFGDAAGKSAGSRFGSVFSKAARVSLLGATALGVGAIKIASDSISAASDLAESTNKVQQVFGSGSSRIFKFTERAADAFGQTNTQARDAAATFGIFGRVAQLTDRKNARFSIRMTKLASDLASFNNTSPEQAIEALGAALRGESEPIRAYGVLLDEATLKAEAMRIGLLKPVKDQAKIKQYQVNLLKAQDAYNDSLRKNGEDSLETLDAQAKLGTAQDQLRKATEGTVPQLTAQQKVLAAQSSILRQTSVQQGDFARTSEGLANQQRRLTARWENAKAALGEALLPVMSNFVDFLLDKGIPAVEDFSDWFSTKGMKGIGNFAEDVKDAWGEVKSLVKWLDNLPNSGKLAGLAAVFAGGVKLRGAGLGGGGGITGRGGALGPPVKVFETNPAALGAGGLGGGKTSFLGKLGVFLSRGALPVSVVAWSGVALKDFLDFDRPGGYHGPNILGGGKFNDWLAETFPDIFGDKNDPIIARDAFDKVRTSAGDVVTQGRKAQETWRNFFGDIEKPHKVNVSAPGLPGLLGVAKQYDGILKGIPKEVRTNFVMSVQGNNVVPDIGGNGGRTPLPQGVTNDNRVIINGDVRPQNYNEFELQIRRKQRARSGGGR